ncbi:hypothetical protein QTP88_001502 [Uroleucon formosanum]
MTLSFDFVLITLFSDVIGMKFMLLTFEEEVLIAIKVQYPCHRLIIQEDLVEQLFVKIHINSICLIVGSIHINVIDNLMSKNYNDKFLVLGDYNLTNVNWVINNQEINPIFSNNNLYESNILPALP